MDIFSYLMGRKTEQGNVVLEGDGYTFTDPNNDGNIVITENPTESEVNENG